MVHDRPSRRQKQGIMAMRGSIDGDNIIYHYLRDELIERDSSEGRVLIRRMIHDLSIWLPIELYRRIPVLLPFVVRDPSCRKSVNKRREEWGSCDSRGYFRDDNTLVKSIPRRYKIASTNRFYSGRKLAKGFVACHVWRKLRGKSELGSRNPMSNTFVPNLVWLPRQISKLTDREGSFAQQYLQALSISIFKPVSLPLNRASVARAIWKMLDSPKNMTIKGTERRGLNFFEVSDEGIQNRVDDLLTRIATIKKRGGRKLYCSRYLKTYVKLPERTKISLENKLSKYASSMV